MLWIEVYLKDFEYVFRDSSSDDVTKVFCCVDKVKSLNLDLYFQTIFLCLVPPCYDYRVTFVDLTLIMHELSSLGLVLCGLEFKAIKINKIQFVDVFFQATSH